MYILIKSLSLLIMLLITMLLCMHVYMRVAVFVDMVEPSSSFFYVKRAHLTLLLIQSKIHVSYEL